jgi:hypothetical protein
MECVLRWLDELDCSVFAAALVWQGHRARRWRRMALMGVLALSPSAIVALSV